MQSFLYEIIAENIIQNLVYKKTKCFMSTKSIKYYNADMKRVLTSQNLCFMNNMDQQTPSEYIILDPSPTLQHERELGDDTPQADRMSGSKQKRELSALDCYNL